MNNPGDGFVRTSGAGWWSTERVPPPPEEESAVASWDDDPIWDSSVLANPNFLAVCAAVALTQIVIGFWLIRGGLKLKHEPGTSPKPGTSKPKIN